MSEPEATNLFWIMRKKIIQHPALGECNSLTKRLFQLLDVASVGIW
jgi:hypothetical protein